jgi:hypothetical protein
LVPHAEERGILVFDSTQGTKSLQISKKYNKTMEPTVNNRLIIKTTTQS